MIATASPPPAGRDRRRQAHPPEGATSPEASAAGLASGSLVITEAEAAKMLRLSGRTLQRMRLEGGGPAFVKLTDRRVGYTLGALAAWVNSRSVANTAQHLGAKP
jgi:hypothetical protein